MAQETRGTFPFRIEQVTARGPRAKTFRLRPPAGEGLPFSYQSGQHMGLRPFRGDPSGSGPSSDEAPIDRQWQHYSLSSSPLEGDFLEVTVLRQGEGSERFHRLEAGRLVEATLPAGRFVLEDPAGYGPVFIGGGIGMAPLRSMLRTSLETSPAEAITLFDH